MIKELKELAEIWKKESEILSKQSNEIYRKLESGEAPQDDETIYSVYELMAQSVIYDSCASTLMYILKGELK